MAATVLSSIPCSIESGNTTVITMGLGAYTPTLWPTANMYLSLNAGTPVTVAATTSGNNYTFTLTATASAAMAIGSYDYAIYVIDASSNRETAQTGKIQITPNLAVAGTPSTAQAMVTQLEATLLTLATTGAQSASFNGQSWSKFQIGELQTMLRDWKSRVAKERREDAARRGEDPSQTFSPTFGNGSPGPFSFKSPYCP